MRIGPELVIRTSKSQKKKSLPKRAGRRSPCHGAKMELRRRQRKLARKLAQHKAQARNIERGYSEWDKAKAARRAKRG